ncbi:MAG: hypothetical protein ACP5OY_08585 [Halothiobacillaceae bacterium]
MNAERARDREHDPAHTLRGWGLSAKWVPIQPETGWALGLRLDGEGMRTQALGEVEVERGYALATYRWADGSVALLNVGEARRKDADERDGATTWGLGYEHPLLPQLKLTTEVFGEDRGGTDKAVGLRYQVFEGLKLSAAIGRGSGRGFGQAGFA